MYIYIYKCQHIFTHTYKLCIHMCIGIFICAYIHTCIHTYNMRYLKSLIHCILSSSESAKNMYILPPPPFSTVLIEKAYAPPLDESYSS